MGGGGRSNRFSQAASYRSRQNETNCWDKQISWGRSAPSSPMDTGDHSRKDMPSSKRPEIHDVDPRLSLFVLNKSRKRPPKKCFVKRRRHRFRLWRPDKPQSAPVPGLIEPAVFLIPVFQKCLEVVGSDLPPRDFLSTEESRLDRTPNECVSGAAADGFRVNDRPVAIPCRPRPLLPLPNRRERPSLFHLPTRAPLPLRMDHSCRLESEISDTHNAGNFPCSGRSLRTAQKRTV